MAELTENLRYKEYKFLCQLYLGKPLSRLIKSLKTKQHVTVPRVSTLKSRAFKPFARTNKFNVLSKFKGINTSLHQWWYGMGHKTFLWVLFSNVSNFIIINSLVN